MCGHREAGGPPPAETSSEALLREDNVGATDTTTSEDAGARDSHVSRGASLWNRAKRKYHLLEFHALPPHLQDNEYIVKGYRAELPLKQAVLSIFRIHNETGNIWT